LYASSAKAGYAETFQITFPFYVIKKTVYVQSAGVFLSSDTG